MGKKIVDFPPYLNPTPQDSLAIWDSTDSLTKNISLSVLEQFLAQQGAQGPAGPSGASGSGWSLISSSDYTASSGDRLLIDTSGGSLNLTLPSNPSLGNEVEILGTNVINRVNIAIGSQKFKGGTPSFVYYQSLYIPTKFVFVNTSIGWIETANLTITTFPYSTELLKDSPYIYLRLNETSGTVAVDSSGNNFNCTYVGSPTLKQAGRLKGDSTNYAVTFTGSNYVSFNNSLTAPTTYTIEAIFKTTSTGTVGIAGYGNSSGTNSGSFDRDLYMSSGKLTLLNYGGANLVSPLTYNDGNYHIVTAVLYSGGAELWVDGSLVSSSTNPNAAGYAGYWHAGYSAYGGYFVGTIDEISFTHSRVSQARIQTRHSTALS